MTKSMTKAKKTEVVNVDYYADFMETIDTNDLIPPEIVLMQKTSKKVEEEEAKIGEFREKNTNQLYGDKKNNLIIAPVAGIKKAYVEEVFDNTNTSISYKVVPFNPRNPLPASEEHPQGILKRQEAYKLFCLPITELDNHIKADTKPFPCEIVFKGASFYAARQIFQAQFMYKNMRKPPFALMFEISATQATSKVGGHTYYKMVLKKTEEIVDSKRLSLLRGIFNDLNTASVKVAESEEEFF